MSHPLLRTLISEMVESYLEETKSEIGSYDHTAHNIDKYFAHTDKGLQAERDGKDPSKHYEKAERHLKIVHNSVPAIKNSYKSHRDIDPSRYKSGKQFADYEHPSGNKYK